jgi:tetratricopeptide (TPR) repeat protein
MRWWFADPDAAQVDLEYAAHGSAPGTPGEDRWIHAFALLHLGRVRLRQERYDDANALFDEADLHLDEIGDGYLLELAVRFRARGATLQGHPSTALSLAQQALGRAEQLGHMEGIAISLLALGEAQRELGLLDDGEVVLRRAVDFSVAADHVGSICQGLALLAAIEHDRGNRAAATTMVSALLTAQAAAGLPILTPGGVIQRLVEDLLDGQYPSAPPSSDTTGSGRAQLHALARASTR